MYEAFLCNARRLCHVGYGVIDDQILSTLSRAFFLYELRATPVAVTRAGPAI